MKLSCLGILFLKFHFLTLRTDKGNNTTYSVFSRFGNILVILCITCSPKMCVGSLDIFCKRCASFSDILWYCQRQMAIFGQNRHSIHATSLFAYINSKHTIPLRLLNKLKTLYVQLSPLISLHESLWEVFNVKCMILQVLYETSLYICFRQSCIFLKQSRPVEGGHTGKISSKSRRQPQQSQVVRSSLSQTTQVPFPTGISCGTSWYFDPGFSVMLFSQK